MAYSAQLVKPRWKSLIWIQAILLLLWVILKMVPSIEERGAGGAVDLLYIIDIEICGL